MEMPTPLPEGVWAETFTYANGKTETIYKRAMAEEGPVLRVDGRVRYLVYMYGHFVFIWSQVSRTTVDIGFGTIDSHHIEHREVAIVGNWNPDNLINFGRQWRSRIMT